MKRNIEVHIREVSVADVADVQSISRATFLETFANENTAEDMQQYLIQNLSLTQLSKELNNPNSSFYFAIIDRKIVGYLKINTANAQTVKPESNALEIERIYILQAYQGLNIGKKLLSKAVQEAKTRGLHKVWLGVWEHNTRAIHFYQQHGFQVYDSHIFQLGTDLQTDLLMQLAL